MEQVAEPARSGVAGLRPLGTALRPLVKPLLKKRPPLEAALLLDWNEAVGPELAALCQPLRLKRERRAETQVGALEVACLSWAALELQHRAPQVIERVNAFLGVPAVERLRIRQVARLPGSRPQKDSGPPAFAPPPAPPPVLPSSGNSALDLALARLAGTLQSQGHHEAATQLLTRSNRKPNAGQ